MAGHAALVTAVNARTHRVRWPNAFPCLARCSWLGWPTSAGASAGVFMRVTDSVGFPHPRSLPTT